MLKDISGDYDTHKHGCNNRVPLLLISLKPLIYQELW